MDWKDEMKEAMKAIKKACGKNTSWTECYHCPFFACCNAIEHENLPVPDEWRIGKNV